MDYTQIFNQLWNASPTVLVTLLGAAGVSILAQFTKTWLKLENNKVIILLVGTISFLASAADYLLTSVNIPPTLPILGSTATLVGLTQFVYHWFLKPASAAIGNYRTYRATVLGKVEQVTAQPNFPLTAVPSPNFVPEAATSPLPETTPAVEPTVPPVVGF